jgi:hypothetical protein
MYNGYETEALVKAHISDLLHELRGAEARGDKETAKACREQLEAFGHEGKPARQRAEKRPAEAREKRG